MLVWVGMLVALPGIWLVSREPAPPGAPANLAEGLLDGIVAGLGFGLLFVAIGQVPEESGFWPVAVNQVVSFVAVAVAAWLLGGNAVPRRRGDWWGLVAGVFATLAVVGFLIARQQGLLSVSAVLTSLYPAATVLLAPVLLHERLHRGQSVGLLLCGVSVVCVALG
jgi:drug/metabolite transporter (DMT)-like permease